MDFKEILAQEIEKCLTETLEHLHYHFHIGLKHHKGESLIPGIGKIRSCPNCGSISSTRFRCACTEDTQNINVSPNLENITTLCAKTSSAFLATYFGIEEGEAQSIAEALTDLLSTTFIEGKMSASSEATATEKQSSFKRGYEQCQDDFAKDLNSDDGLVELLSSYAHEAWSEWMLYLFSKCGAVNDLTTPGKPVQDVTIPKDLVARWWRQVNTHYSDLTETEKQSDREQARKIIHTFSLKGNT